MLDSCLILDQHFFIFKHFVVSLTFTNFYNYRHHLAIKFTQAFLLQKIDELIHINFYA